jgi:hypothetical protein
MARRVQDGAHSEADRTGKDDAWNVHGAVERPG